MIVKQTDVFGLAGTKSETVRAFYCPDQLIENNYGSLDDTGMCASTIIIAQIQDYYQCNTICYWFTKLELSCYNQNNANDINYNLYDMMDHMSTCVCSNIKRV